jgi:catechol 2,3-dioxygenase-like lactoylglutathione lyase family enzyme
MGFELVKVNVSPTPGDHGGWSKHFFYRTTGTGGSADQGMIAFWEIHDAVIGDQFPVDINEPLGLPWWVNHLAFDAPSRADLDHRLQVWRDHGCTVAEIDHGFCVSIYTRDPNGNMVEFCHTLRPFTDDELANAQAYVMHPNPPFEEHRAKVTVHQPLAAPV